MNIKKLLNKLRMKINRNYLGYRTFMVLDKDCNLVAHVHTDWFEDSEISAYDGYHLDMEDE